MKSEEFFSSTSHLALMLEDLDTILSMKRQIENIDSNFSVLAYETLNASANLIKRRWGIQSHHTSLTLEDYKSSYLTPGIKRTITLENLSYVAGKIASGFFSLLAKMWEAVKKFVKENFSRLSFNQGILKSYKKKLKSLEPGKNFNPTPDEAPKNIANVFGLLDSKITCSTMIKETDRMEIIYKRISGTILELVKSSEEIYAYDIKNPDIIPEASNRLTAIVEKLKGYENDKYSFGTEKEPLPTGVYFTIKFNETAQYPSVKLSRNRVKRPSKSSYRIEPPTISELSSLIDITLKLIEYTKSASKEVEKIEKTIETTAKNIEGQFKFNTVEGETKESEVQSTLTKMYKSLLSISNLYTYFNSSTITIIGKLSSANITYLKKSMATN